VPHEAHDARQRLRFISLGEWTFSNESTCSPKSRFRLDDRAQGAAWRPAPGLIRLVWVRGPRAPTGGKSPQATRSYETCRCPGQAPSFDDPSQLTVETSSRDGSVRHSRRYRNQCPDLAHFLDNPVPNIPVSIASVKHRTPARLVQLFYRERPKPARLVQGGYPEQAKFN
jgi:hypothetical protein